MSLNIFILGELRGVYVSSRLKQFLTFLKVFERYKLWTLNLAYFTVICTVILPYEGAPPPPFGPRKDDPACLGSTNAIRKPGLTAFQNTYVLIMLYNLFLVVFCRLRTDLVHMEQ